MLIDLLSLACWRYRSIVIESFTGQCRSVTAAVTLRYLREWYRSMQGRGRSGLSLAAVAPQLDMTLFRS